MKAVLCNNCERSLWADRWTRGKPANCRYDTRRKSRFFSNFQQVRLLAQWPGINVPLQSQDTSMPYIHSDAMHHGECHYIINIKRA